MTIVQAIKKVMLSSKTPMTAQEIYKEILKQGLFEFRAADPEGIVKRQLRRHCEGLDLAKAPPTKHFRLADDSHYELVL